MSALTAPCSRSSASDGRIVGGVGDDRDRGVVLRRGADERRAADVDLLDEGRVVHAPGGRRLEGVEVHADEVERLDARVAQLAHVVRVVLVAEHARRDPRMERLHAPAEHLRRAGHLRDVGHRQAGLAKRGRRAAGRHELEAELGQRPREVGHAGLVRDRDERAHQAAEVGRSSRARRSMTAGTCPRCAASSKQASIVASSRARRHLRIGLEQVAQRTPLVSRPERAALHDRVRRLAAEPGGQERVEDPRGRMEAEPALDVLGHPLRPHDEVGDERREADEHVVQQGRRPWQCDALDRRVADIALVPERLVLQSRDREPAQERAPSR